VAPRRSGALRRRGGLRTVDPRVLELQTAHPRQQPSASGAPASCGGVLPSRPRDRDCLRPCDWIADSLAPASEPKQHNTTVSARKADVPVISRVRRVAEQHRTGRDSGPRAQRADNVHLDSAARMAADFQEILTQAWSVLGRCGGGACLPPSVLRHSWHTLAASNPRGPGPCRTAGSGGCDQA